MNPTASSRPSAYVRPAALDGRHFSTVIIGAGINGVGVFRDLSLQGVDCLVVDKGDIASGASSAPSRMIHGGLRYLEHGSFALVAEATHERNLLLRNAPHLVRPLKTVVPLSNRFGGFMGGALRFLGARGTGSQRGLYVVSLGLRLYDLLGRRERVMPNHRITGVAANDQRLLRSGVRWTAEFFDAWIRHPEWLIHELIVDAHRDHPGSVAATHCRATSCEGKVIRLRDEITGKAIQVTADCVVNATGAWLDQSARVMNADAARVIGTKGSHLILDHPELHRQLDGRMVYFEAADGRVCIVYPFLDRVLVGSTDIPVDNPDHAVTDPQEVRYLLDVLGEVFPRLHFDAAQVLYTYVGVRPLARAPADRPGQIPREHSVVTEAPNDLRHVPMVCLVGGKWTTFRALAQDATDQVLQALGKSRVHSTAGLPIGGGRHYPQSDDEQRRLVEQLALESDVSVQRAQDLFSRYGTRALEVIACARVDGDDRPLIHAPDYSSSEVRYLCRQSGVAHLDDLVLRRTLLAIGGRMHAALLQELCDLAAQALQWSAERARQELDACSRLLREHHGVARLNTLPHAAPHLRQHTATTAVSAPPRAEPLSPSSVPT
ncbi:glycerol-3-phosphate dehydrogenase/oxidase [Diaphorobacter ruginosibacter]|uniref:Glycerol-3-phosphate dehydrogenase/oxidase n=1 Tax=Diaphorobacter ruginosibacter TaxID=1715720 RepID=A0A7G9RLU2_9BURK|nr:glycerol-3-phosphate dehydrogenase/oxidase [Diaphorobacter ruginosibacter]QNN56567.1 glycerol-3-phosphate dehydrogenase/oxidase [Diaphorobacter ruginosibacter]